MRRPAGPGSAALPTGTHCLLFDTAFGRCALAWSEHGLTAVSLPGYDDTQTLSRLQARPPPTSATSHTSPTTSAPAPPWVAAAVTAIQAHLSGQMQDLRDLPLDTEGVRGFELRFYAATRALDPGRTCTYGQMARALGEPAALRAVGQALGHNPWPLVVPCHRVLAAGGKLGGFSAPGGSETKRRLLVLEARCGARASCFDRLRSMLWKVSGTRSA